MALHHIDFVFARREEWIPPRFVALLEAECQNRGMSFLHCRNHEQAEMLRAALGDGTLTVGCLVDYMGSSFRYDYELGCAVKDCGGLVVDDPDRVRLFRDKVVMHQELAQAGIAMPETIVWRSWQPARDLTIAERDMLGTRIVCKPAGGSGAGGVVLDFAGTAAALAEARDYDPDDHYLLQEFVTPLELDGKPAWFRVYNCFGRIFICFWHPETHEATLVTPLQKILYGLEELEQISQTVAHISGYTWFSTEICMTERDGQRVFLPIDYLNNKCFMIAQSEFGPKGMPDAVVEAVAQELVVQAQQHVARRELRFAF
ncbi:MAG: hypothetical protein MUD01_18315 [Chloroflexaceae bacterium]|jgi:hypothetical protein|nr:hypothetical protein [Chloroflexaceae bacterium]